MHARVFVLLAGTVVAGVGRCLPVANSFIGRTGAILKIIGFEIFYEPSYVTDRIKRDVVGSDRIKRETVSSAQTKCLICK